MKVTITSQEQSDIFDSISIDDKKALGNKNIYADLMFIAADNYITSTLKKQGVGIVLTVVGETYFNDVKEFQFKGSKKKMQQNNYVFVGAKKSDINFYGFLSKEDLFELAVTEKRGLYKITLDKLKPIEQL